MKKENRIPIFEEYGVYDFQDNFYETISPVVKQFLIDYYGERFYNLESTVYREIEEIIEDECYLRIQVIPDILYRYRTITDSDLWDEAFSNYVKQPVKYPWPEYNYWYYKTYNEADDSDFLNEIPENELTEHQKMAKELIVLGDSIVNYQAGFSNFMKQGCALTTTAIRNYIEETSSFDLSILQPDGFEELQNIIDSIEDTMFDKIYGLLVE